jgi:hypothetical protein
MKKQIAGMVLGMLSCGMMLMADDASEKAERSGPGMVLGEPLWRSQASDREPVLFIREEGKQLATGKLLFIPSEGFQITHPDLNMRYEEGKDYTWKPGTNVIELTVSSRIPYKTAAEMMPPAVKSSTQVSTAIEVRVRGRLRAASWAFFQARLQRTPNCCFSDMGESPFRKKARAGVTFAEPSPGVAIVGKEGL